MDSDRQLLRQFTQHNSQQAFAALTARYLSLVYSTCRRELDDASLAEDVTQAVFLILARKAPTLRREVVLSGWLFQTARFAARNARLQEARRKAYEARAAEALREEQMKTEDAAWSNDSQWKEIEPLLNQSLAALRDAERECVLLRFFQGMTFAEAGASLGMSEEAARKRVSRGLNKMRSVFIKNGVIVPAAALAALLTTHAAKAAPVGLAPAIARSTAGVVAGHINAGLTGPHVYNLSEGVMKAMRIFQIKLAVGITTAVVVVGAGAYGVVRSAASTPRSLPLIILAPSGKPPVLPPAEEALIAKLTADSMPSQYRTVALMGRVRRADGAPTGRVHVCAKIQDAELSKLFNGKSRMATPGEQEVSASLAHTKPDGTYTLYVGDGFKYNVFITRENTMKVSEPDTGVVAAVVEDVSGSKGSTVSVPDLVLTPGGIITGTIFDKATGRPIAGANVLGNGVYSPQSTTGILGTQTDSTGTYRLRVAPGKNLVYEADSVADTESLDNSRTLEVAEGQTATVNFQVTPKQPSE